MISSKVKYSPPCGSDNRKSIIARGKGICQNIENAAKADLLEVNNKSAFFIWAFARTAMPNLSALEDQLADVMREANRRGYIIVNSCMEQKYGNELWRPDLFAMLQAIQQGRVNAVVVQSLDRLSHDLNVLYMLLLFMQKHGAVLITTKTNLRYELYLTGLESRLLNHPLKTDGCVWEYEDYENAKC